MTTMVDIAKSLLCATRGFALRPARLLRFRQTSAHPSRAYGKPKLETAAITSSTPSTAPAPKILLHHPPRRRRQNHGSGPREDGRPRSTPPTTRTTQTRPTTSLEWGNDGTSTFSGGNLHEITSQIHNDICVSTIRPRTSTSP